LKREIVIDGKTYKVEVARCDINVPFSVKVNDKPVEVTLEKEPDYKNPFTIKIGGKPYVIELTKIDRQAPFSVKINNIPLKVELKPTATKMVAAPVSQMSILIQRPSRKTLEEGVVVAPMAGKIISIKVKKEDSVKVGDVLCILEAMKMENEITTPKSGIVEEVAAQEGKAVNEGDVLVVIK